MASESEVPPTHTWHYSRQGNVRLALPRHNIPAQKHRCPKPKAARRQDRLQRPTSSHSVHQVRGAGSGPETQLRVSWEGILNAQHTGRWWIVGSAWSGAPMIDSSQQKVPPKQLAGTVGDPVLTAARRVLMSPPCLTGFPCNGHLVFCLLDVVQADMDLLEGPYRNC